MEYSPQSYLSLPEKPGVYRFHNEDGVILYVGKAKDLKSRVSSYFVNPTNLLDKTRVLVSQVKTIQITTVETEIEALLLESFYIKKYRPKYNIRLADDKTYPLIKITIHDASPSVLSARRPDDHKALYFGPFPNSKDVRLVLRVIRRIFPFQSVPNHPKRVCLYHHLGLCPCLPVYNSEKDKKTYKTNLKRIVALLEGKSKKIQTDLERERDSAIKQELFEEAKHLTDQITALEVITKPHKKPLEYDVNPNLRDDLRAEELKVLKTTLSKHGVSVTDLRRIECFDISNIQGTNATGSMVVFEEGEKAGNQYRRFKVHKDGTPNDFAMMEEVLIRRIKHTEWRRPDLLIVDGGKGQVTAAQRAFAKTNIRYPLIGLAKREETIVVPTEDGFTEISLPKTSPAIHLITRIRDEAHRFAITYHRKVRSKQFLKGEK